MFKKTLISLAVASSLGLTGCLSGGDEGANADPEYKISNPDIDGKTWPVFNAITGELPIPNDLIFDSVAGDGTFRVTDTSPPVTTALNSISGASTVAPAVISFNGQIDEASVDARAFLLKDPSDPTKGVIPNPKQNVFLIELDYASGDPVRGLSIGEPPTIPLAVTAFMAAGGDPESGAELAGLAMSPAYESEVVQLDGQSAIRINPLKPLDPQKRYLVVVTKEVLDINGDPVIQSPNYNNITDETQPLGTVSLAPVRSLVNKLWEPTAASYFQVTNGARPDDPLTTDDIAMTYSFTTSNDEKVLQYIAEPAAWFADQLTLSIRVAAATAVVSGKVDMNDDGAIDYTDVNLAANGAVAGFPDADTAAALGAIFAAPPPNGCATLTGQIAIDCVGFALANTPSTSGGFADLLPTPQSRAVSLDLTGTNDVTLVSTPVAGIVDPLSVNIVQGTIELPYYLGVPSGSNGSPLQTEFWNADNGLAAVMNLAFKSLDLAIPQADESVSDVVNYIFPFPELTEMVEVPLLVLYPSDGDISGGTVIFQHGITTDRSTALTFGSALADAAKVAVVAIDQPLHGVTPASQASLEELATSLLDAGQDNGLPSTLAASDTTVEALIAGQLNLGFVMSATGQDATAAQATIDTVLTGGTSDYPDLDPVIGYLGSAENTVANAGSTVPGIAKTEDERHFGFYANEANQPVQMNFDPSVAAGEDESGSLFINLSNFLNGRDNLRQGSVDLMNLRASLGAIDINGPAPGGTLDTAKVYFVGHSLGTINGSPFVAASNQNQINLGVPGSTKTSDDIVAANLLTPGGGIIRLLENSPAFAPKILGGLAAAGLEQGDANLETYFNVYQATLDTVDPINFSDNHLNGGSPAGILLSEVIGDTVIPNSAEGGNTLGNAFAAPLAGTEPLATTLNASKTRVDGTLPAITRYTAGTHSTPVSADDPAVFAEMVTQAALMISTSGISTTVVDTDVVEN